MTKLVILSDTHGLHKDVHVPDGDILIHAGDLTNDPGREPLRNFLTWFQAQPHKHKVFIAGNHDLAFEKWPMEAEDMVRKVAPDCIYLENCGKEIDGIKFWGSPITPVFCDWAFNRERGEEISNYWKMVPKDTQVLITHGPPFGHLDVSGFGYEKVGCRDMLNHIYGSVFTPDIHCFGHIHHSYGTEKMIHDDGSYTWLFNASICDEGYKPTRKPWVFDYTP